MTPENLRLDSVKAFETHERLRDYLKLTVEDILPVLGVTRPTYYSWKRGRKLNTDSTEKARKSITTLLAVARHPEWQKWQGFHLTGARRRTILAEVLAVLSTPVDTP